MKLAISILVLSLLSSACTDRAKSAFKRFGNQATILCYSGEYEIYRGKSSGKVSHPENLGITSFVEAKTGRYIEISGTCIVTYEIKNT